MTCAEFRRLNATDAALWAMTRHERARCRVHYSGCLACQHWLYQQKGDGSDLTEDEAARLALRILFRYLVEEEGGEA